MIIGTGSPKTFTHDPIDVCAGRAWEFSGELQDADGDPLVLDGVGITWWLESVDGLTRYASLSRGNGITLIDEASSAIVVNLSSEATAALAASNYVDRLRVTLVDGAEFSMWVGVVRVAQSR